MKIRVDVVHAVAESQTVLGVELDAGATIEDAISASGVFGLCPEAAVTGYRIGIWGRIMPTKTRLRDGDRVEIYRPLKADPKQIRRKRAGEQRVPKRSRRI